MRAGFGPVTRMAVRSVAVLVAVSGAELGTDRVARVLVLIGLAGVLLALVAVTGLGDLVRRARQLPVSSRGLALSIDVPAAPPAWTGRVPGWPLDIVVSVVAVVIVSRLAQPVEIVFLALAVVVALTSPALAIRAQLTAHRCARRLDASRMTAAVEDALDLLRPDVALYFAGPAEALYQLTMWLPTFERLTSLTPGLKTMVVLRNPEALLAMPPTSLPVMCAEHGNALAQVRFPSSLRLACYVSNAAGKHPPPARAPPAARVHRPRRLRQDRQHGPLRQGVRRDLGGRTRRPRAVARGRRRCRRRCRRRSRRPVRGCLGRSGRPGRRRHARRGGARRGPTRAGPWPGPRPPLRPPDPTSERFTAAVERALQRSRGPGG